MKKRTSIKSDSQNENQWKCVSIWESHGAISILSRQSTGIKDKYIIPFNTP